MLMAVSAPNRRVTAPGARTRRRSPPRISRSPDELQHAAAVDLESLSAGWQRALDAANGALRAAAAELPDSELRVRTTALRREQEEVVQLLAEVAKESRPQPEPWLSPAPVTNAMLGLPATARACLFDVEGVLTDSAVLHAGLAKRKGKVLERRLEKRRVAALPGARRYLEAARRAGLKRAVVSASRNTSPILERAGLSALIDERLDATVIRAEGLRSRPAPDLLLAGCRRLDVAPADAITLTTTAAGVAAGRTAGLDGRRCRGG